MKDEKDLFDTICSGPIACFLIIFIGSYLLWWLVLDGPAKWDKYFEGKRAGIKDAPILLQDPLGLENNKK